MVGNVPLEKNGPRWTNAEALTLKVRSGPSGVDNFTTTQTIRVARRQITSLMIESALNLLSSTRKPIDFVIWNGTGSGPLTHLPSVGDRLVDANHLQYEILRVTTPNPYTLRVTALQDR